MNNVRTYQRKFSEEGQHYDFEHSVKLNVILDVPFTILKGFVKTGNYGKQVTMFVEMEDGTFMTVQTGSAVIVKQFEEEEEAGFPVKVKARAVTATKSGNTYLTFTSPDED